LNSNPEATNEETAAPGTGALHRLLDRPIPPDDLTLAAESAAKPADPGERGRIGIVLFGMSSETFALPANVVRRVTPFAPPVRIPHRSSGILRGVCNVRGELVLCGDLRALLGMPALDAAQKEAGIEAKRTMVIGPANASWAFEVDALRGIGRIEQASLAAAPLTVEHALGAFVTGLAEIEGTRVTVLDGERVLAGFKAALV